MHLTVFRINDLAFLFFVNTSQTSVATYTYTFYLSNNHIMGVIQFTHRTTDRFENRLLFWRQIQTILSGNG